MPLVSVPAALAIAGMFAVLLVTRWGIGTSVDSVAYLRMARELSESPAAAVHAQHAPLYSILLAVGAASGLDPMGGARWLNALTFGVNIFLAGLLIRHSVAQLRWLPIAGSMLMLLSAPMLAIHATALSEPIFLSCMLGGFWMLAQHLESPTRARLVAAAALIGLALLARYAGAACILAGIVALALNRPGAWRLRVRDMIAFGAIAAVPMAAWMARNLLLASTATGRDMSFHPVSLSHAWQALYTLSGWLLIPPSAPNAVRFAAWLAIGLAVAIVAVRALRASDPVPAVVKVLSIFVVTYGVFLAASISFVDANTPLDDRILLPILVSFLVLGSYGLDTIWPLVRRVPAMAFGTAALAMILASGHGLKAAGVAAAGYEKGWGFTSATWRQSPTLNHLAGLDRHVLIYSNAPELVYLHTGRDARGIPRTRFLMNQQPNREFAAQMTAVGQEVRERCGVVVYLRNLAQQAIPREAEVGERLSLDVLRDEDDGVIWGLATCPR